MVASEVKELANQTSKATEDISSQIVSIQGSSKDAVVAIEEISKTMLNINELAVAITAAVEEQEATTNEISQNVQQAAAGTSDVAENMAQVTRASQETNESACHVLEASQSVASRADELKSLIANFLDAVKAA